MKKLFLIITILGLMSISLNAQDNQKTYGADEVSVQPEFPGGVSALIDYLAENTKYPESARVEKLTGKIYVKFVVDENGDIINVQVANEGIPVLNKEAIRVVETMPSWKPGQNEEGDNVPVSYVVPINFELKADKKED